MLVAIVVTGFAVLRWTPLAQYLTVERVSALLTKLRESWWAPLALIGSYIVLCPLFVPASPMMIAGGMVFGPVLGHALQHHRHLPGRLPDLLRGPGRWGTTSCATCWETGSSGWSG